jgi:Tol biopolymer transport system component
MSTGRRGKTSVAAGLGVAAFALALAPGGVIRAQTLTRWSTPENLGEVVNSPFNEDLPHIAPDGLSLYFISNRPNSSGPLANFDIWVSQRDAPDAPWGRPRNLGPVINTSANDRGPCLSPDGLLLFFSSDRAGGTSQDIWVARRQDPHDDFGWQAPRKLGPAVNTDDPDFGAAYLDNDETDNPLLYFGRREGFGDADIYVSELLHQGFTPGTVVTELSTESDDLRPTIRPDGLELYFNSNRPGSRKNSEGISNDLWVSTRQSVSVPWSTPRNLGLRVNTEFDEQFPALSSDGETLIFSSNRPVAGISVGSDLYVSKRELPHP